MTDLLSELEQATNGSRELSDKVLLAIGWQFPDDWEPKGLSHGNLVSPNGETISHHLRPNPTENLQDALELVPEGWYPVLEPYINDADLVVYCADLFRPNWGEREPCRAHTPTLAFCIATLKARECTSQKKETEHG